MKIYLDLKIQFKRFSELFDLSQKLDILNGIKFVENVKECDLVLLILNSSTSLDTLEKTPSRELYIKLKKPIIILERLDSAVTWVREFEKYNIIGILKNRVARDAKINNTALYSGRYHAKLITDNLKSDLIKPIINGKKKDLAAKYFPEIKILSKISPENLNKIQASLWDFNSSPVAKKMNFFKNNTDFTKTIDVFCVHTIRPGVIGEHRKIAINTVNNMKNIKSFTEKCSPDVYNNNFIQSKICVACWGFGEWTHMDGYALYSKTILVKPNTDHVQMEPDLYNSKRYIPCKPDFSDLEEIIKNILNNYEDYKEMLEDNRTFAMSLDKNKFAKKFWDEIKSIYESSGINKC
jgi:hypothetical protein